MSDDADAVGVTLDLRRARVLPRSEADFQWLWMRIALELDSKRLEENQLLLFDQAPVGPVSLRVMHLPKGFVEVTSITPFAIQSVLEPLEIGPGCQVCAELGHRVHAPLLCAACRAAEHGAAMGESSGTKSPLLCTEHAIILDGSLRTYCPAHAPQCDCGKRASGFCLGPICTKEKGRTFCEDHLRPHPSVPDLSYCHRCYERLFPPCGFRGCDSFATIRCSHWDPTLRTACNKGYCARHALRWQVYGSEGVGLARCVEHGDLSQLSNEQIIFQITAGAVVERRKPRWTYDSRLPSLQAVTHILMKPRNERYPITEINRLFEEVRAGLDASDPFQRKMIGLLDLHRAMRQRNLERDADDKAQGRVYFDELVAELRRRRLDQIVADLRFADYRPLKRLLFVHLREDLQERLYGFRWQRRRELESLLGVCITFERGKR